MDGVLCIHKPEGMTSFSCCSVVRRLTGEKKVGHAGTLDPNATGVLPVLLGKATKLADRLPSAEKRYTATLRFGAVSDTLDVWGTVKSTDSPIPTREQAESVLPRFSGNIQQIPPMTSALKKDGVRLYELARQGIEIPREARSVTIHSLQILSYDEQIGELVFDCACSKGTYIRSICDDWGKALGCGAIMTALCRTQSACYTLDDCLTPEEARRLAEQGKLESRIRSVSQALQSVPSVTVTAPQANRFRNGGALALERLPITVSGRTRVLNPEGTLLGLGIPVNGELTVDCLL